MHSTVYPNHEEQVAALAESMHIPFITQSSAVVGRRGLVGRGHSACVEAYLVPIIREYLSGFLSGLKDDGRGRGGCDVWFMHSDGGLVNRDQFSGVRAILSGPAAGVVGTARTAYSPRKPDQPVIGFDMGGTSTDVSRYAGALDIVFESQTAGLMIHTPQLDVVTVAAGGGSQLFFRHGMLVVGPESAG
jgi:5-oxoprolinase (ATP-hydrolysing)